MPTFPRSPLSFRTAGFPQYGWKAGCQAVPSRVISGLSLLPAFAVRVRFASALRAPRGRVGYPALCRVEDSIDAPPWRVECPPPQGPSLGSGLCCPGPSSLNRPHPPHSQAHRDFTAWRLIRDAFAVRERLGDPRVVPGFRCPFLPDMPSSPTPGSRASKCSRASMPTWPSPSLSTGSALPKFPQSVSRGARISGLHWFAHSATACQVARPPARIRLGSPSPRGLLLPGFRRIGRPPRRWI